jgi:hypothetical protein
MPIVRQNALAVLCPPAMRQPIRELIESFDRPGRQVMIAAIIAEVELTDDFAFGLRISSGSISPTNLDNALSGGLTGNASNEGTFLDGLFDTSTLELNFDVNVLLQALSQKTNVRILQEPAVFTADNQEAYFFDGQDVPFISESQSTDTGSLNQSFDYKAVGVSLNVRPRITAQNDVDMEIYLELSSIVPGQTLFGGFIVDRRSTTTQIVVRNDRPQRHPARHRVHRHPRRAVPGGHPPGRRPLQVAREPEGDLGAGGLHHADRRPEPQRPGRHEPRKPQAPGGAGRPAQGAARPERARSRAHDQPAARP